MQFKEPQPNKEASKKAHSFSTAQFTLFTEANDLSEEELQNVIDYIRFVKWKRDNK